MNTLRGRLRAVIVISTVAATAGVGVGFSPDASAKASGKAAAARCQINFQASSLDLAVGQDLVLTWTAVGASRVTASWASGYIPLAGAVTTTKNHSGRFSYQVTGTKSGKYCGSAGVEVAFRGSEPSQAVTSSAPASSSAPGGSAAAAGTATATATATSTSGPAAYPAQSPTSGSGVPWYQQPAALLSLAVLALLGSLVVLKRKTVRAAFVREH